LVEDEDDESDTPILRPLVWMGSSKRNIQAFPREAQKLMGDELQLIQFGGMPKDAKPFKGLGSGVFEIALHYDTDAYRTVLAVQTRQESLRASCLPEEIQEGCCHAEERRGIDSTAIRRGERAGEK